MAMVTTSTAMATASSLRGHRLTLHVNSYLEYLRGSFKPVGALALAVAALASDTGWTLEHVVIIINTLMFL